MDTNEGAYAELLRDPRQIPGVKKVFVSSGIRFGYTMADASNMGYTPEQVQDFYPTPSTMSTCMFYTGVNPRTMEPVYIPRDPHEKAMRRTLIQYRKPENYKLVKEVLRKAGREDLIGYGAKCLIRPVPRRNAKGRTGTDEATSLTR